MPATMDAANEGSERRPGRKGPFRAARRPEAPGQGSPASAPAPRPSGSGRLKATACAAAGPACVWIPEDCLLATSDAVPGLALPVSGHLLLLLLALASPLIVIAGRQTMLRHRPGLKAASAALFSAGAALALASLGQGWHAAYALGVCLAGVGFGLLNMMWGEFFSDIPLPSILRCVLAAAAAALAMGALSGACPAARLAYPALPLAAALLLGRSDALIEEFGVEERRLPDKSVRLPASFATGIAMASFSFGGMSMLSCAAGPSGAVGAGAAALASAASLAALAALFLRKGGVDYTLCWKIIVTVMVAAFAALAALGAAGVPGCSLAAGAGYAVFEYVAWVASMDVAKYSVMPPLRFLAFTAAFTFGGQCLGAGLAAALCLALPLGPAAAAVGLTGVGALTVAIIWFAPTESVSAMLTLKGAGARRPQPADGEAIRRAFGLTAREAEVAGLLASGRSARFIQEQLGISEGTAWTHIRHIYQKTGTSSRQEFITAMERLAEGRG